MSNLKQLIKEEALRLGFSSCGFARNDSLEELRPFYSGFIQRRGHAILRYLETNFEKRMHPELALENARTVIAVLINYFPREIIPEEDNFVISKYAYGKDYRKVIRKRLNHLVNFIQGSGGDIHAKAFVDSGAVLEKAWAQKCGVGFQGKNTIIINRSAGSFFFIGIILTDLETEPDVPETSRCGNCTKCMEACPTGALEMPYQLNIRRCIAYLTLESSDNIPDELRGKLKNRVYGCDICQDACPYNRFARPHNIPEFLPHESLMTMRKNDWINLTESEFDRIFTGTPVKRAGHQRLMRNIEFLL